MEIYLESETNVLCEIFAFLDDLLDNKNGTDMPSQLIIQKTVKLYNSMQNSTVRAKGFPQNVS